MTRITQSMLDHAVDRLVEVSKVTISNNDCYGYYQLRSKDGQDIHATLGDTKKDLYYQIQFYLQMKSLERNNIVKCNECGLQSESTEIVCSCLACEDIVQ